MHPDAALERTSYVDVVEDLERVQLRLERLGISRPDQNRLNDMRDACRRVLDAYEMDRGWKFDKDRRDDYLQLVGAADLVRLFAQVEKLRELRKLDQHLKLLVRAGFGAPSALVGNDASRKVFELLVGLACLAAFEDVELEDPERTDAKNPNPDIKATFDGYRVGLACKSISTKNREGLFENIELGVGQVEKSDVDFGFVVIDVSRRIEARAAWPEDASVWDGSRAADIIGLLLDGALETFRGVEEELPQFFKRSKALPCVMFYGHAAGPSAVEAGIVCAPTSFKGFRALPLGDHSRGQQFLNRLNLALHDQLRGGY